MVLNFDQLWRSAYEAPKRVLHKRDGNGESVGGKFEIRPDYVKGKRLQAVLEIVQGELEKRMASAPSSKLRKTTPRTENVQGGRFGLTAVTSVWGNGEMGPLGICIPTNSVALSFQKTFNADYSGHAFLFESGSESHFMSADTTLLYLQELVAPALCLESIKPYTKFCFLAFSNFEQDPKTIQRRPVQIEEIGMTIFYLTLNCFYTTT